MSEDRSNLKKKILSVVVSVYNEEQALKECYTEMKRVLDTLSWDHELIFVNDGSGDQSLSILERLAAGDSKSKCKREKAGFQYGSCVNSGNSWRGSLSGKSVYRSYDSDPGRTGENDLGTGFYYQGTFNSEL